MNNYYNFYEYVAKYHRGEIIKDACLKDYCTLKIGGKCLCVYKPNSFSITHIFPNSSK